MRSIAGPRLSRLHRHPEFADTVGRQLAIAALGVDLALEAVERNLAHHRIDHVLDLGGDHGLALLLVGDVGKQRAEGQHLPNTLAVSASVSGVGAISAPCGAAST